MIKYLCTVLLIVLSFTTKVYANPLVHTSLGAIPMSDWTTYRLDEKGIRNLAEKEF